jgi:hypothetical protein
MRVLGIDFTSAPNRSKPLTCLNCTFDGHALRAGALEEWPDFSGFEETLRRPGPWIAGMDFPFGQSRKFIETIGWPTDWHGYVSHTRSLGRADFRDALNSYRQSPDLRVTKSTVDKLILLLGRSARRSCMACLSP